jgi:hypothetical protein
MTLLLLLWLALFGVLMVGALRRPWDGGVLTLTYFLTLSLIHVPGVLAFVSTESDPFDREATEIGFQITLVGLAAFVAGAIFAHVPDKRYATSINRAPHAFTQSIYRVSWRMIAFGLFAYLFLLPVAALVPSSSAIVGPVVTTLVIGMWLRLYSAAAIGDRRRTLATLVMLPLLPLVTLATGGFLGFGVNWAISVLAFLFVISRHRIWYYIAAPVAVILGLSLFVSYMGEREGIRDMVWQQNASYSDRLERMSRIVTNFQLLDLSDPTHRAALASRLNQNSLVGLGVLRYRARQVDLAYGGTVGFWALIPRAIWPDKPEIGGANTVVSDFTGLSIPEGTSVGAGQVLEFYFNFGLLGVVVGFLGLGILLMRLDGGIIRAFAAGDPARILLLGMPGLALIQPGGNLLEIMIGSIGALITSRLILAFDLLGIARSLGNAPSLIHGGARHR